MHQVNKDTIIIGQIDDHKWLRGVGIKIHPWRIIEGQFNSNELDGFGRHLHDDGLFAIGFFKKNDLMQGYGKVIRDGKEIEGHWDLKDYQICDPVSKELIESYHPNLFKIAMELDYGLY